MLNLTVPVERGTFKNFYFTLGGLGGKSSDVNDCCRLVLGPLEARHVSVLMAAADLYAPLSDCRDLCDCRLVLEGTIVLLRYDLTSDSDDSLTASFP
jgi:hypothetical protein